ncbi:MAG: hypothetical protein K1X75_07860 [Leptospirales bacterium]|nr:hypothetical protein [Leptospirales bacterium]
MIAPGRAAPGGWHGVAFVLLLLPLLSQCDEPEAGEASTGLSEFFIPAWRPAGRSTNGRAFRLMRAPGAQHLLVYAPRGADGAEELQSQAERWRARGYTLLTLDRPAGNAAADAADFSSDLADLLELALRRGAYRSRSLVLALDRPGPALEWLQASPIAFEVVVIARFQNWHPGEREVKLLHDLSARSMILTPPGLLRGKSENGALERGIRSVVENYSDDWPNQSVLNWMELGRSSIRWRPATESFRGGCLPESAELNVSFRNYQASGRAEEEACPLFLAYGREVWTATEAGPQLCTYSSGKERIHCRP